MKLALALAMALTALLGPGVADTDASHTRLHIRCDALTDRINVYRSPNLRLRYLLCKVGARRAYEQARAGRLWHDLRPVKRALAAAGVCWRVVGEVVAYNSWSATARTFVNQWRASAPHWDLLSARRYDRGGGSWTSYNGRHFATYYVLDLC